MASVREPAVAGLFYPADPDPLRREVETQLAAARKADRSAKALIVPHAGYVYSGPVAATCYAALAADRDAVRRVILLGPAHRMAFSGLGVSAATHFRTPLGDLTVDREARTVALALPQVREYDPPFEGEHSLEVQLPFLQVVLSEFRVLPILVGWAEPDEVAEVIEALWDGPETRVVVSSDLSHYHDYVTARRLDEATARDIEARRFEAIGPDQACGCHPLCGLLQVARRRDLPVRRLDLRSSGDTAGPRDRVVGYGSFAVG